MSKEGREREKGRGGIGGSEELEWDRPPISSGLKVTLKQGDYVNLLGSDKMACARHVRGL